MDSGRAIRVAILVVAAIGVAGATWSLWNGDAANGRDDVDVLDRLDPTRPLDEHVVWAAGALAGERLTEEEVGARISDAFAAELPPAAFVASVGGITLAAPIEFEGVIERDADRMVMARFRDADGIPFRIVAVLAPDGQRLDGLLFSEYDPPRQPFSPLELAVLLLAVAALVAAGMEPGRRDPAARASSWWLLVAAAAWAMQLGEMSATGLLYTMALTLPWAAPGIVVAVLAVEATGTDGGRHRRTAAAWSLPAVGGVVALAAGAAPLRWIDTERLHLPRNLVAVTDPEPAMVERLADVRAMAAIAALAVAGTVVADWRRRSPASRPEVRPPVAALVVAAATLAASGVSWIAGPRALDLSPSALVSAALVVGAVGIAVGGIGDRVRRGDMAQLVVDLGGDAAGGSIEAALRRALDDPSLELFVWSERDARYLRPDGTPAEPDLDSSTTKLDVDGRPVGLVAHGRRHRPEQIRAACSAVGLAVRNAQLQAEVRQQLDEVRASRTRLLAATDDARRALERDLHDGAQQRILSAMVEIQRARRRLDDDPAATARALELAGDQLEATLDEVRNIARGLRPGAMDRGLVPAVRELADACPIPVDVRGGKARSDPAVEHAAWFVISEALTNATRHSAAGAVEVDIDAGADGVAVTVHDDGCGGAAVVRGGGLEGIVDRVEALGGTISVDSPPGRGTTLELCLPSPSRSGPRIGEPA